MIPELGQLSLILGMLLALAQTIAGLFSGWGQPQPLMRVTRTAAMGQFIFVLLAFLILTWSFLNLDFSVRYVAEHANLSLPWYYRITAVWGAHEGSMLLWIFILNLWTVALLKFSHHLPAIFAARVLGILGFVSVGFLCFTLFTSNPFIRLLPPPENGVDLNPILQDPGMILHPPLLYMGYVGFSVSFAFAVAALLGKPKDQAWLRAVRPWTNAAWSFLTLGIVAGSWWSYTELGWGGWWSWDPVENASFMPWLTGIALIHAQAITEKRGRMHAWTILLSIFSFSLSLLGTFLVRSGVLTSIHSFAHDRQRGIYMLLLLGGITSASLLLYAWRTPKSTGGQPFALISRESALLIGNLMLIVACAMVLLGTLFPLFSDIFQLGQISVGAPYFGWLFFIFMVPVVIVLPFGPYLRWGSVSKSRLKIPLLLGATVILTCVGSVAYCTTASWKLIVGLGASTWIAGSVITYMIQRKYQMPPGRAYPSEMIGMALAHFGVAIFLLGVFLSEALGVMHDVRMSPGQIYTLGSYHFRFDATKPVSGANWHATQATVTVMRHHQQIAVMYPQQRIYAHQQTQTRAALHAGLIGDLYVALGQPVTSTRFHDTWTLRIYYRPFIRWIWAGGLFMALGGLVVTASRRFRTPHPMPAISFETGMTVEKHNA